MSFARWITQLWSVSVLNLRNLQSRLDSSLVAIVGFTGVVTVFVGVFAIREGFRATLQETGSPSVAIVMRGGAGAEINSVLGGNDAKLVGLAPGVVSSAGGPLISQEVMVQLDLQKKNTDLESNVPFRGVDANGFLVHDKVHIVAGRPFNPGLNEVLVGVRASHEYKGLEIGNTIHSGTHDWKVVGLFDDGGLYSSEVWGDLTLLQGAYQRGNSVCSVFAKLGSPAAFQAFKDALTTDPRLNVSVQRETDYYAEQSQALSTFISIAGSIIGILMGIGAVFGAINTMYNSVSSRATEIATLRAIGFGRSPVLLSVL
ncbi:MAG TPA: ABC transporter permease, partial [Gammaproteobacteria bacterium]|nr:ABC transporter permease [Gammaproteobacteria bacterium]